MDKSFETAEELYTEGKSKVKEGYGKAQQKIDELMKDTQNTASKSWEDLKGYCSDHPAQALGIAVAAGAVLGFALTKALSRSDSDVEHRIRKAVRTGHETWEEVRDGFEQAVEGIKGAFEAFKR